MPETGDVRLTTFRPAYCRICFTYRNSDSQESRCGSLALTEATRLRSICYTNLWLSRDPTCGELINPPRGG